MPPDTILQQRIQLPNIFIVGPSGSGKTSSFRNLPPEKTAIINVNRKALPFRGAQKFKYNKMVSNYGDVSQELQLGFGINPAIDIIVIDDFTSTDESIVKSCRTTYNGYEIYAKHNEKVRDIIAISKNLTETQFKQNSEIHRQPKWIIFTGLDELYDIVQPDGSNKTTRRIKVEGRELRGTIEKEFTIVLFTEVRQAPSMGSKVGEMEYKFITNADGICSAKTPMDLFKDKLIDNDLNMVIEELKKYYELPLINK